jgi:hypothetical protein
MDTLGEFILRFGFATAVAGILLWFMLTRVITAIDLAREGQAHIMELCAKCCSGAKE